MEGSKRGSGVERSKGGEEAMTPPREHEKRIEELEERIDRLDDTLAGLIKGLLEFTKAISRKYQE